MQFFFSHHRKIFVHFWAQKKTSLLSFTIDFFFFNLKRHLRTQYRRVSFHFWQRKQKSDNNFDKVKFLTKKCLGLKTLENNAQCHVPFLKYGFCKKSPRKDATLTSWTLLASLFSRWALIWKKSEAKSVQLVRVAFFRGDFLQNPYFSLVA